MKYTCLICGFTYDEEKGLESKGIPMGTKFSNLPSDFCCPLCKTPKSKFRNIAKDAQQIQSKDREHQII